MHVGLVNLCKKVQVISLPYAWSARDPSGRRSKEEPQQEKVADGESHLKRLAEADQTGPGLRG